MARDILDEPLRRSARNLKRTRNAGESSRISKRGKGRSARPQDGPLKQEATPTTARPRTTTEIKAAPVEPSWPSGHPSTASPREASSSKATADKAALLRARKLKSFSSYTNQSPFPSFPHPTPFECSLGHRVLASLHGERHRPDQVIAPAKLAGCGNSPSVLDALVRTILSQNTSDKNSTRAKLSMDAAYGGSDKWDAIVSGGQAKLQRTIQSGGLSVTKSKVILGILQQVKAKYGTCSLDHLFRASDEEAMREMLSFQGVGPKTASCVLLFCLQRASFAVDTHVYRITGLLGWRPEGATREGAQAHLDARVPDKDKYGLHVLLVTHGKQCEECKAGGKNLGKCALRKAFGKGEAGAEVKQEELEKSTKEEELDL